MRGESRVPRTTSRPATGSSRSTTIATAIASSVGASAESGSAWSASRTPPAINSTNPASASVTAAVSANARPMDVAAVSVPRRSRALTGDLTIRRAATSAATTAPAAATATTATAVSGNATGTLRPSR
jgi:hypothetical protein